MNLSIIGFGAIGAVVILFNPFLGLLATVALIPLSVIQAFGGSVLGVFTVATPIKIIGGLTFISAFLRHIFKRKGWDFLKEPQIRYFIVFLILIFISGFSRPGPFTRENFTSFLSFAFLGFIFISLADNKKKFRFVLWIGLVSVFIACLNSILSSLNIYETVRLRGSGYGPNEFAIGLLPFIGIGFYSFFYEKKKILKVLTLVITVTVTIALVLTFSRGGLIGFAGMILIGALKAKRKFKAILFLVFVVIMALNFMPEQVWERFEKTKIEEKATGDGDIASTTRRYYLAKAAWDIFSTYPLFGIGIGNYYYECRLYQPVFAGRAHNMYLEIMAELGILGILLFLGILFFTFKSLKKIRKSHTSLSSYGWGLYIGLIGFLIAAIFLHAQQEKVLWLVVFMTVSLERIVLNNSHLTNFKTTTHEK